MVHSTTSLGICGVTGTELECRPTYFEHQYISILLESKRTNISVLVVEL